METGPARATGGHPARSERPRPGRRRLAEGVRATGTLAVLLGVGLLVSGALWVLLTVLAAVV